MLEWMIDVVAETFLVLGQTTPLWTFTIVTTGAAEDFRWLHDRQPVILSTTESLQAWLDTSSQSWTPELSKLVQPYSGDAKLTWLVSPKFKDIFIAKVSV